ncbi:dephospho-CoA kinase [Segetibacter sp. 3557_3]|uniref:dephospho-CoA kinase n=1 Tax=Segetibacter sp. 3557_3 TaxID=2547429 RepID=UPI0010591918|nr:dephospho-CoA kinase [Segetibacter sp. 3557_3]TDH28508.1 dephospho-CoA kinase [Segetibacter sp. 3557_3]
MLKVGLTGGIGSGKSLVARIFTILGIPVFDADREAKKLMVESREMRQALVEAFGTAVYKGNDLDRPYLANLVFKDRYQLDRLNAIVHPLTIAAADRFMQEQKTSYVVKEAALLFEAGSAAHLDLVVGVFAPVDLRIKRVMERDNLSYEEVTTRMKRQIADPVKMKLCDNILYNNEQQLLVPQVIGLHKTLLSRSGGAVPVHSTQ